jgi:hypothetical protein
MVVVVVMVDVDEAVVEEGDGLADDDVGTGHVVDVPLPGVIFVVLVVDNGRVRIGYGLDDDLVLGVVVVLPVVRLVVVVDICGVNDGLWNRFIPNPPPRGVNVVVVVVLCLETDAGVVVVVFMGDDDDDAVMKCFEVL